MSVEWTCETPGCEVSFKRYPSHVRRGIKRHCTQSCANKHAHSIRRAAMAEQADAEVLGASDLNDHGSSNLPSRTCCIEAEKEVGRKRCGVCSRWLGGRRTYNRQRGLRDDEPQKSLHGLSRNEFKRLKELQPTCRICGVEVCQSGKRLSIDHDHETGVVRGLLCMSCNTKLGWFEKYSSEIVEHLKGDVREIL